MGVLPPLARLASLGVFPLMARLVPVGVSNWLARFRALGVLSLMARYFRLGVSPILARLAKLGASRPLTSSKHTAPKGGGLTLYAATRYLSAEPWVIESFASEYSGATGRPSRARHAL